MKSIIFTSVVCVVERAQSEALKVRIDKIVAILLKG